ncbi:MAG: RHS repeat-associated core domain-containing protein [Bacteroidota bacterium]|nr:RHS repeat-associated core domain-containing protein [Bacteroidota bacterium]
MFADLDGSGTVSSSEILQENHYYPFGLNMEGPWMNDPAAKDSKYLYNGKELNDDFGLEWYAYGARYYDPVLARFSGTDPISNKFPSLSTYNYAGNKPINGIDLHGLQWVHFQDRNNNVINVNVTTVYSGTRLSRAEFQSYLTAVKTKYTQVVEQSSGGTFTGSISFDDAKNQDVVVPDVDVSDFSNSTGVAGASGLGKFAVSVNDIEGNLQSPEEFALDFLHELFHTARLDHPFEVTQAADTKLLHEGGNNYSTVEGTDPNILYNMMNYPNISINGARLGDLWKVQPGDKLTIGQLYFLVGQIQQQMQGAGTSKRDDYWDYWLDDAGTPVEKKNK